jgi:hypothetical protein
MGIIDHPYLDREYDVRGMSFHGVGMSFGGVVIMCCNYSKELYRV